MAVYREQEEKKRTNRCYRLGCCAAVAVLWLVAGLQARAQWSLTQFNVPVTEDFSSFTAPSTWGTANPAANQLDSDIWAFSQTNITGSTLGTFGLNYIFGRGINTGGVSTFGVYAFDTGTGVKGIGPQADDTAWSPGNLTIKLQNDTGSQIDELRVEWSYLLYNDQTGRRASQLLISDTDTNNSYLAPNGGFVSTLDAPQSPLFWLNIPRDLTFNVSIPDGDDYYLRWTFTDITGAAGSGVDRDEVGIADLRVTPVAPILGDFDGDLDADGEDFLLWQRDPGVGSLADWEASYGTGAPLSATSTAAPEPATGIGLLFGMMALLFRRNVVVS